MFDETNKACKSMLKVGITCRVTEAQNYTEKRNSLALDWNLFFRDINAVPIIIPNNFFEPSLFFRHLGIDALVLSGGNNVSSSLYKGLSNDELSDSYLLRDEFEYKLIEYCIEHNKPVLGVCHGMQLLNVFFGGSLSPKKHHSVTQHVNIQTDYFDYFEDKMTVNSYHDYCLDENQLGESLIPFSFCASDKTIEGFSHKNLPIIGIQWHPERGENPSTKRFAKHVLAGASS